MTGTVSGNAENLASGQPAGPSAAGDRHGAVAAAAVSSGWATRWERRLYRLEQLASLLLLWLVLATMGAQTIFRYALRMPLPWSEELARWGLIWLSFVAAAMVAAMRQHIAVDLLTSRWRIEHRRSIQRLCQLLMVVTCGLILFGGWRFVWRVSPVASPALGLSMSLWYAAASIGAGLIAAHNLLALCGSGGVAGAVSEPAADLGSASTGRSGERR